MNPKWIKGQHESASRIGQYMHDHMPRKFDVFDGDHFSMNGEHAHMKAATFKKARNCMRIIEEKLSHEQISTGQNRWMNRIASMMIDSMHGETGLAFDSAMLVLQWLDDSPESPATPNTPVSLFQVDRDGSLKLLGTGPVRSFERFVNGDECPELRPSTREVKPRLPQGYEVPF